MNYTDIENKIRNIVALQTNKDVEEINPVKNIVNLVSYKISSGIFDRYTKTI